MEVTDQNLDQLQTAFSAIIRTPRLIELHSIIKDCQTLSKATAEPQCIALEGATGVGKSTLIKDYTKAFPRRETEHGTEIPVFYMETPSPVTVKGMAAAMLEQLGDPAAHRGTLAAMNSRLINLIIDCHVELLILDDFQHLIDLERDRILEAVSDWLKYLIKETGVPFLVVGIEGKVTRILQANAQLSRLFAFRESLQPFKWNPQRKNDKDTQTFVKFIEYAEQVVGIQLTDQISRRELLSRLHYATDGFIANIMNLLRYAALLSIRQGQNQLTLATLESAYKKRLAEHMAKKANPFSTLIDERFTADAGRAVQGSRATGRRMKGGRKRQVKMAEVLRK